MNAFRISCLKNVSSLRRYFSQFNDVWKKNDEDTTMFLKRNVYLLSIHFVFAIEKEKLNMDEMEHGHSIYIKRFKILYNIDKI